MKNFEVRDFRWSKQEDFNLPVWHRCADWLSGYIKLWIGSVELDELNKIVYEVKSYSLFEQIVSRKLQCRIILIIPVSVRDNEQFLWFKILQHLKLEIPDWNTSWGPVRVNSSTDPSLVLCLDPPLDNKVTVLIPHWESLGFLELCLYSLRKLETKGTEIQILVCDDNSRMETWLELRVLASSYGARAVRIMRPDGGKVADVGAVLDFGLRHVLTPFVCMLDADTVIEDSEFVNMPIELLRNRSVLSVGLDTNLGESYHSNRNWNQSFNSKHAGTRPPGYYSITNNLYRVMRTSDARAISDGIGFSRAVSQRKMKDQFGRFMRRLATETQNKELIRKSKDLVNSRICNSRYPNMPPTGDNGVAANGWMDSNMMGCKVNVPIFSFGYNTPTEGVVFQNIGNLLSHIALSTRALSQTRREVDNPGLEYIEAVRKVVEREGTLQNRYEEVIRISKNTRF